MRGVRLDPERVEVRLLLRLSRYARTMVGIDPQHDQIELAKTRVPAVLRHKIRYQVGHAERLPYRAGAFDVVLFSWSL